MKPIRIPIKHNVFQKLFLIIVFSLCASALFSQNHPAKDSVVKKDSALIYKKIQNFAYKRKLTYWLFQGIFREIKTEVEVVSAKVVVEKNKIKVNKGIPKIDDFKKHQGKIIRNIRVVSIDPLGQVQGDSIAIGRSWLEKTGNKMHVRTIRLAIKNQILFEKGEPLDSLKLLESERILRSSGYLNTAKITSKFTSKKKDSVDVLVIVRDLWTIEGSAGISPTSNNMEFSEKNILGTSHQVRNALSFNLQSSPSFTSAGSYLVPNIRHSFISGTLYYNTSAYNKGIGLSLDRGFFSPLTKWAGGINVSTNHSLLPYTFSDGSIHRFAAHSQTEDIWVGRGFSIRNDKFNAYRDPRLLLTARIFNSQFIERPSFDYDTLEINHGSIFYLSSIGFSTRNYYQDKNIYAFGRIEDVPEGRLFAVIGGVQINEFFSPRPYYGFKFSYGKHIDHLGYLAINAEYGSFIHHGENEKGVMNTGVHYFNDLWTYHKWSMRQFVDIHTTNGIQRNLSESININGSNGLEGFDSPVLKGFSRGVVTFANVIYLPYKVIGFQFATILFASFAGIGQTSRELLNGKFYQGYGFGFLLRNEFLVVKTFQISFGYYPQVPGVGNDVIKFNPLSVSDLRLNDLHFTKPDFIGYN